MEELRPVVLFLLALNEDSIPNYSPHFDRTICDEIRQTVQAEHPCVVGCFKIINGKISIGRQVLPYFSRIKVVVVCGDCSESHLYDVFHAWLAKIVGQGMVVIVSGLYKALEKSEVSSHLGETFGLSISQETLEYGWYELGTGSSSPALGFEGLSNIWTEMIAARLPRKLWARARLSTLIRQLPTDTLRSKAREGICTFKGHGYGLFAYFGDVGTQSADSREAVYVLIGMPETRCVKRY